MDVARTHPSLLVEVQNSGHTWEPVPAFLDGPVMTMAELHKLVVFRVAGQRYALPLACVERMVRAVEVTAVPGAPDIVLGAICVEARILPVLSVRRAVGIAERDIQPNDHFLIGRTSARVLVLAIDEPDGVVEVQADRAMDADQIVSGLEHVSGIVQLDDGLVVIQDLERFLSPDEARRLDAAIAHADL